MSKKIFKDFIYLFLERGEEWEKARERNIDVRNIYPLIRTPTRGPTLPPRHVPWPGIKPAALRFTARHPTKRHQLGHVKEILRTINHYNVIQRMNNVQTIWSAISQPSKFAYVCKIHSENDWTEIINGGNFC